MTRWPATRNAFHTALIGVIFAGACLAAATAIAAVETFVEYGVSGRVSLFAQPPFESRQETFGDGDESRSSGAPVFLQQTFGKQIAAGDGSSTARMDATAAAVIGQFKLRAAGVVEQAYTLNAQVGESDLDGHVTAHWRDSIKVSTPTNEPGGHRTLHGKFLIHGSMSADATAQPEDPLSSRNFATAGIGLRMRMTAGIHPEPLDPGRFAIGNLFGSFHGGSWDITIPDQQGETHAVPEILYNIRVQDGEVYPLFVEAQIIVSALARRNFSYGPGFLPSGAFRAEFAADLSNTIRWGGIDRVTDTDTGELIEDWTITSESGFDYSRPFPIPEPSSVWLLIAAAAGLACGRGNVPRR